MLMPEKIQDESLAVCGVNCLVCSAYWQRKNPCPGCTAPQEQHTRKSCQSCAKRDCARQKSLRWCFACGDFPCAAIKSMSKRYATRYDVDLIDNGLRAKDDMPAFWDEQKKRFTCPICGGVIDQHRKMCSECGAGY